MPLSLIGTFGVMYLCGYSLNNLSLMALTISTGFVVDDAIVMIENIARYIEEGDPPFEAALKGAKQIGFTIVSLTVSLVAVLIPLLFMGGIIGRLFREFAVTLAIAIGVSAVLSLTLTAMMCAHLLKPHGEEKRDALRPLVRAALRRSWRASTTAASSGCSSTSALTLVVTIGTVALTRLARGGHPQGLLPAAGHRAHPRRHRGAARRLVRADDGAPAGARRRRPQGPRRRQRGLVHRRRRHQPHHQQRPALDHAQAAQRARRQRGGDHRPARSPGSRGWTASQLYLQPVQDLQIESRVSRTQFQYTLEDADPDELAEWAPQVLREAAHAARAARRRQRPAGRGPAADADHRPRHRGAAGHHRRRPSTTRSTTPSGSGRSRPSSPSSTTTASSSRSSREFQQDPDALGRIYVRAQSRRAGAALARSRTSSRGTAPLVDQPPGAVPGGHALVQPRARRRRSATRSTPSTRAEAELGLPPGVHADFQGTAQAFRESLASEPLLILAALITVYIVLGVLYESYIHPITILSTLPSAGVGALLALIVCRTEFSIIALIGIILLIGIVKKNAIMMIDFALEAERDAGHLPREAIHQACLLRFRPIMMTTMAALLGGVAAGARHAAPAPSCAARSASPSSAACSSRRC